MHNDDQVDGDAQKPEIILYYNSTKSGVDNLDHLATMYTSRRKVNRWPVALFGNVVDVGAVAAFIIWMGNFPQWKISEGKRRRRLFLSELANQLVMPHIRRRALTPTLQAPISNAMKMVGVDLPPPVQQAQALTSAGKRKRCHLCPRGIDKKVRLACDRCKQPVCPSHSVQQLASRSSPRYYMHCLVISCQNENETVSFYVRVLSLFIMLSRISNNFHYFVNFAAIIRCFCC